MRNLAEGWPSTSCFIQLDLCTYFHNTWQPPTEFTASHIYMDVIPLVLSCVPFIIFPRQGSITPKHVTHICQQMNEGITLLCVLSFVFQSVSAVVIIFIPLNKYSNFATIFADLLSFLYVILFRIICGILSHSASNYSLWTEMNLHLRSAFEWARLLHNRRSLCTIFRLLQRVYHVL